MKNIKNKLKNASIVAVALASVSPVFATATLNAAKLPQTTLDAKVNTVKENDLKVADVLDTLDVKVSTAVKALSKQLNIKLEDVLSATLKQNAAWASTINVKAIVDGFPGVFKGLALKSPVLTSNVKLGAAVKAFFIADYDLYSQKNLFASVKADPTSDESKFTLLGYQTNDKANDGLANMEKQVATDTEAFNKAYDALNAEFKAVTKVSLEDFVNAKPATTPVATKAAVAKPVVHKITVKEHFGKHTKVAGKGNATNNFKLRLSTRGYHFHGTVKVSVHGNAVKLTGIKADKHYKVKSVKVTKDRSGNYTATINVAKR